MLRTSCSYQLQSIAVGFVPVAHKFRFLINSALLFSSSSLMTQLWKPSPVLKPNFPSSHSVLEDVVMDVVGRGSNPTMFAFSRGPSWGSWRPKEYFTASSTATASVIPCSTIEITSRHRACCLHHPIAPGDHRTIDIGRKADAG